MLDKLTKLLNIGSGILFFLISLLLRILFFFPGLFILKFPFLLVLAIVAFFIFVPVFGSLLNIALWIWAFIVCLGMPTSFLTILFYILFTLNAIDLTQAIIRTLLTKPPVQP